MFLITVDACWAAIFNDHFEIKFSVNHFISAPHQKITSNTGSRLGNSCFQLSKQKIATPVILTTFPRIFYS